MGFFLFLILLNDFLPSSSFFSTRARGTVSSSTRASTGSCSSSTEVSTVSSTRGTGDGVLLLSSSRATDIAGEEICSFSSSLIISWICCFFNSSLLK